MQNQQYKLLWLLLLCTNIAYSQINSNITISSGATQLNSPTQTLHIITGEPIVHYGTGTTTKLQAGFHYTMPTATTPINNINDVTFFTNDTLVQTSSTIGVPLYIKNVPNTGIAAFQIVIEFDSSQLRYSHVMDDFLGVQSNLTAPQQISCTFNSPSGFGQYIPDSTLLTYLYFEILMPHNDFTLFNNINTTSTSVYDANLNGINYNTAFDTIRAFNQVTISGKVVTRTGAPMPYVAISTSNPNIVVDTTDMLGEYHTLAISGSNLTITPNRNNDQNPTNGVSSLDALRVIRDILRIDTFTSPYQHIAADVSQDNDINILDVIMIRRLILGITTDFNGVLYKFMPSNHTFPINWFTYPNSRSYTNVQNIINQDYIGVKLGDIDGNWNNALRNNWSSSTITLSIDSCHIPTHTNYSLAVKAQGMNDVSTFQMTIQWDSAVAALENIVPDPNWMIQYNYYAQNTVTIVFTSSTGLGVNIPDGATLFGLDFKAIGAAGTYTDIEINSEVTSLEAYDGNLDPLNIITEKGLLNIVQPTSITNMLTSDFTINISPNPFNNQFQIQLKLDTETFVNLELINPLGQTILQQEVLGSTGDNNITWELPKSSIPSGHYFLKVTTNNEEKTFKVIKQ